LDPGSGSASNAEAGEQQEPAGGSVPRRLRWQTVLIAEDSKIIRGKLVSILSTLDGVRVRVAADGVEALGLCKEEKPDLLLTDNEMPGLTGLQLVRVLRGIWSRLELPILMLTSNTAMETKVSAFRYGANDYVTKPVEPAELCARVRGQLDLKGALQESLEARVQLLEARKYQAVGRLAAAVAHELNNPAQYTANNLSYLAKSFHSMRSVLESTIEWANSERPSDTFAVELRERCRQLRLTETLEETPAAVAEAQDGIARMAHIIAEMKEFAGDPEAGAADLDLNHAVRNSIEVARAMWSPTLDVELALHPRLPSVRGVEHPIKQAFLNVLTNAVEAVASLGRKGQLRIATAPLEGGAEVCFTDDGPGIAPEVQRQLFEPFFTTKPLGQGTGQGLFVAYAVIVEQNGGRLSCESQLGAGATFRIWLPGAPESGSRSETLGVTGRSA
jgi:two-component system NtrC family sensor kinase